MKWKLGIMIFVLSKKEEAVPKVQEIKIELTIWN